MSFPHARAVQLLATPDPADFVTAPVPSLALDLEGIPGDRHRGFSRPAGPRERWYQAGTPIRSGRQLTLVSAEELAEIARRMDLPGIDPAWLGANILLRGVPALTLLPWGTRLVFAAGAVLVNEGDNAPCRSAGAAIARACPGRPGLDTLFVKMAKDLRGIVASVERAGAVTAGPLRLKLPNTRPWPGAGRGAKP